MMTHYEFAALSLLMHVADTTLIGNEELDIIRYE